MKLSHSIGRKALAIAPVVLVAILAGAWEGASYYTSRDAFCGSSCHIMNEQYGSWQKSKHHAPRGEPGKHATCIDCHFLPGEKRSFKATMRGARHLRWIPFDNTLITLSRPVLFLYYA